MYQNLTENPAERIEKILLELGYNLNDRGKYWQTNAVYRNGDNRTALQIWKDTGIYQTVSLFSNKREAFQDF